MVSFGSGQARRRKTIHSAVSRVSRDRGNVTLVLIPPLRGVRIDSRTDFSGSFRTFSSSSRQIYRPSQIHPPPNAKAPHSWHQEGHFDTLTTKQPSTEAGTFSPPGSAGSDTEGGTVVFVGF